MVIIPTAELVLPTVSAFRVRDFSPGQKVMVYPTVLLFPEKGSWFRTERWMKHHQKSMHMQWDRLSSSTESMGEHFAAM